MKARYFWGVIFYSAIVFAAACSKKDDAAQLGAVKPNVAPIASVATVGENLSPERIGHAETATPTSGPERNVVAAVPISWQYEYGFRVSDKYTKMNEAQLSEAARRGDPQASQQLASVVWGRTGSRELAAEHYVAAIERGSVGAIGELVAMLDPSMTPGLQKYYKKKFGRVIEPNLPEAYLWARTATYRGDLDATFAINRLRNSLTPEQIASLERAAYENFIGLKAEYKKHTGKSLLPMDSDAQRALFAAAAAAGG